MSEEWATKTIGEVIKLVSGRKPVLRTISREGDLPFLSAKVMRGTEPAEYGDPDDRNAVIASAHDLVIICTGSNSGEVFTGKPGIVASTMARIDISPQVNSAYLRHFLKMHFPLLNGALKGMAIPSLDRQLLSALSIPLPPFAEQTRIAQLLDEAFEAIAIATANAEKNLQNARDLIESHLRDSLTKSSEGWTQAKLGSIGQIQMCKRVLKNQTNTVSGVPFYKIGTFGKVADAFIPAELFEKFRRKYAYPMLGEVLISAAGTIGKRVVFDGAPSYFQDSNIVWLKNDESIILNSYLYYYYAICDFNPTKGTTINRLYNDDLRNLVISFPKSLATQRKLISRIEVLQSESGRLLGLYSLKLDQLLRLRQALLQQNFSERIRSA